MSIFNRKLTNFIIHSRFLFEYLNKTNKLDQVWISRYLGGLTRELRRHLGLARARSAKIDKNYNSAAPRKNHKKLAQRSMLENEDET